MPETPATPKQGHLTEAEYRAKVSTPNTSPDRTATIFVLFGTTGEYSDRQEWIVGAYADEAEARAHAERAGARAREIYQVAIDAGKRYGPYVGGNEHDPQMRMDYTGTTYYVEDCEMLDACRPTARTVHVYAEFWVRALTSIAKLHWHRHRSTTKPS